MKIGLDVHGVIDANPKFWAEFTTTMLLAGHDIHIITGPPITDEFKARLDGYGVKWTHIFSIVDHHCAIGTGVWQDAAGFWYTHPWAWDKTKADYCAENQIDLHIDDSDVYGYFFKTPYAKFTAHKK